MSLCCFRAWNMRYKDTKTNLFIKKKERTYLEHSNDIILKKYFLGAQTN